MLPVATSLCLSKKKSRWNALYLTNVLLMKNYHLLGKLTNPNIAFICGRIYPIAKEQTPIHQNYKLKNL